MKIPLILNGEEIIIQASADEPLSHILRKKNYFSVKENCKGGICGSCAVLLNGKPVPSCKLPAGLVMNQQIETLEYFSKTPEYTDIINGFKKADIELCGICNSGKIFTAWHIISTASHLERSRIEKQINYITPCCTDIDTYISGIIYAFDFYSQRNAKGN